jgi:hypothetical protein
VRPGSSDAALFDLSFNERIAFAKPKKELIPAVDCDMPFG